MRRIAILGLLIAALAAPASADPPALSPAAQKAVDLWRKEYAEAKARAAARSRTNPFDELDARVAVDQAGRSALTTVLTSDLGTDDLAAAKTAIWAELGPPDAENSAFLKSIMPVEGWFRISDVGRRAAMDAWLVVQHSPDQQLMRDALARMEPLLKDREVDGQLYALLFDRVAIFDGRKQRYGTQGACEDHKVAISPIEMPDTVDQRRSEAGLEPLADYARKLGGVGVGGRC